MKIHNIIQEEILKLYHGTNADFNDFNIKYFNIGSGDGGWLGKGFYFTNDYEYAESYGDVKEVIVDIMNPYILTDYIYSRSPNKLANDLGVSNPYEITKKLKSMGYDSVMLKYADSDIENGIFIELCIFDTKNIVK